MSASFSRPQQIKAFVEQHFHTCPIDLIPASSDASFRSYWRAKIGTQTYIVMDAPPDKEPIACWLDIAKRLQIQGLSAPKVLAEDQVHGFVLMTDLGTTPYLSALNENSVDALYTDAINALHVMQKAVSAESLPTYNEKRLIDEMELFPEWFLKRHLGLSIACEEWDTIETTFRLLANSALEQSQCFVHRDFHSRNLMKVPANNPGIIDFQDAVLGPITYDLVSLLRDCYIYWPYQRVYAWVSLFYDELTRTRGYSINRADFQRQFDWMGLQRHLKVLGIFCRLYYRDGKGAYLNDLNRVMRYTLEVASLYPQLSHFTQWLTTHTKNRDLSQPNTL